MRFLGFLVLFSLLELGLANSGQAIEYQRIEHTINVKITEEDRHMSYNSGTYMYADKEFWEGRVNPNDRWIEVNISVIEINCPDPLEMSLDIGVVSKSGIVTTTYYYDAELANGSLDPWNHTLIVEDHFEYAFNDTYSAEAGRVLSLELATLNDVDFTGSAGFKVSISLSGWEEKTDSNSSVGFGLVIGFVALVLLGRNSLRRSAIRGSL